MFNSHASRNLRACCATPGLGPSSSNRQVNCAAALKFFDLKTYSMLFAMLKFDELTIRVRNMHPLHSDASYRRALRLAKILITILIPTRTHERRSIVVWLRQFLYDFQPQVMELKLLNQIVKSLHKFVGCAFSIFASFQLRS